MTDAGAAIHGAAADRGNYVVLTPLLDLLVHHSHLLRFEGKNW